ncbi:hypothetical protein [Bacteroides sp.]|uniref:hypothetical protein n=1 Tax=Bacteroides sp. TaxID=29523 RepID=UPI0026093081|nr:hypothetical protein [Bacteroides sp.]MDD3040709.1 hypothetical protein [Bacteroides sp.]
MTILKEIYDLTTEIVSLKAKLDNLTATRDFLIEDARSKHQLSDPDYELHIPEKITTHINSKAVYEHCPDVWDTYSYLAAKDVEDILGKDNLRNYIKTTYPDQFKSYAKLYVTDLEKKFGNKSKIPTHLLIYKKSMGAPIIRKKY